MIWKTFLFLISCTMFSAMVFAGTQQNIVETAQSAGNFKTLTQALQAAGLVDALQGKGPFTVFAPTDEAFAKLPAGTLDGLLKDPEKLAEVLKYHFCIIDQDT